MEDYNLEEAAKQYRDEFLDKNNNDISKYDIEDIFIDGANWRYEQFEKERLKHCDELTAEQAQIESDFIVQHLEKYNRTPTFSDAIEYGRKQMIEKACEWLEDNKDNPFIGCEDPCLSGYLTDQFIADFRNYMKGE